MSFNPYQSIRMAELKFGDHYFQRSFFTKANRYPGLFKQCKNYLRDIPHPQILSFGCSTGEEVFTIGEYMPNAHVTGVDINEWCLAECEKANAAPRFSFYHRLSDGFNRAGNFDAIFCMAVFQRRENRTHTGEVSQGFTFEQFERELQMLDNKLKPGGLLAIDYADFSFTDTVCSAHYTPLNFKTNQRLRNRPQFDSNNKKIADSQNNYRLFVKCT